jgi:hypothetical protein
MNSRAENGAVEAAAVVDERNGPLAHNGLENASRFRTAPTAQTEGLSTTETTAYNLIWSLSRPHLTCAPFWSEEWGPPQYYAPGAGRFVSEDPVSLTMRRAEEQNAYAYVANRPVSAVDPSGLRIYVCTRWVQDPWWLGAAGGRHAYIWSSCANRACGQGNAYGNNPEGGPGTDYCVPVGPDNCDSDWQALQCCAGNVAVPHAKPGHDCHTTVDRALDCADLPPNTDHPRWMPPWFRAFGTR